MNKGDLQVAFTYIIMINKLRLLFSATYGNLFQKDSYEYFKLLHKKSVSQFS